MRLAESELWLEEVRLDDDDELEEGLDDFEGLDDLDEVDDLEDLEDL